MDNIFTLDRPKNSGIHSEDKTMLDNIHHLAIQVNNIDESISWYRENSI